jgi:hypothetical protein
MKLGLGSAAVLTLGGGWLAATTEPGWQRAGFSAPAQRVWVAVGRALLDGVLPTDPAEQTQALQGLVQRLHVAVSALPDHAQQELSQLLTLLASAPGRRMVGALPTDWAQASVPELQAALQDMRASRISLRVQGYLALHDLVGAAYFSEPATWAVLGYPGPTKI